MGVNLKSDAPDCATWRTVNIFNFFLLLEQSTSVSLWRFCDLCYNGAHRYMVCWVTILLNACNTRAWHKKIKYLLPSCCVSLSEGNKPGLRRLGILAGSSWPTICSWFYGRFERVFFFFFSVKKQYCCRYPYLLPIGENALIRIAIIFPLPNGKVIEDNCPTLHVCYPWSWSCPKFLIFCF